MNYRCFVIIPYEPDYEVIYEAIRGAGAGLPGAQIDFVRADRNALASGIEENVTQHLALCDFAIADMSEQNPNVAFEVGYASAIGKPVVIMSSRLESIASNLEGRHFLRYNPNDLDMLRLELPSFISAAIDAGVTGPRSSSFVASGYPTTDSAQLPLAIANARRRVDVYISSLSALIDTDVAVSLRRALKSSEELRVRVLAMDPESPFVNFRARDLGYHVANYRDELRRALDSTAEMFSDAGDRCELRVFDGLPYYSMYAVDQGLFLSFLRFGRQSRGGLTFRMKLTDPGADSVTGGFTLHWSMAGMHVRA